MLDGASLVRAFGDISHSQLKVVGGGSFDSHPYD
jgi:hypothetical protein